MSVRRCLLSSIALAVPGAAQCALQPIPSGAGVPGVAGAVYSSTRWDPDGAGPAPELLVVAGNFTLAGDVPTTGFAAFDPASNQWSGLGSFGPFVASPSGFVVHPNGALLAWGWFPNSATTVDAVMQWNGTVWLPFAPAPTNLHPSAIAVAGNGDVWLAVGSPNSANVHRYSGGIWQTIGSATAFNGSEIRVLAVAPNGDLIAGGLFSAMNGVAAAGIARWNGTTWSPLGAGIDGRVHAVAFASNGDLLAGGLFPTAGGAPANNVARWNGSVWSPLGGGTSSTFPPAGVVRALLVEPNGDVIVGGEFTAAGGIAAQRVARWDGVSWSALGSGIDATPVFGEFPAVYTLDRLAGEVFAGGNFRTAGGRAVGGLARWAGVAWQPMRARGFDGPVTAVHRTGVGELFLGGGFREIDGVLCNCVARRVGSAWQPLGSGLGAALGLSPYVVDMATDANGDLIVAGWFATAGGAAADAIARWNGSAWLPLGTGLAMAGASTPQEVRAMHSAANGDLWVAGTFQTAGGLPAESVARWDGASWSTLPPGLSSTSAWAPSLSAVAAMPNGDVFVAGWFDLGGSAASKVGRWDGTSWQMVAWFDSDVAAMLPLPNGDLLVGGTFSLVNGQQRIGIARWSNGAWSAVGSGLGTSQISGAVNHLALLPNGDVIAAGAFATSGGQYFGMARWDGANWTAESGAPDGIIDLAIDPVGAFDVAGWFVSVASTASVYFARVATPCPATAAMGGSGCSGSGGANVLAATALPWVGSTFTARATGMPNNGLALEVLGLTAGSVPLAAIVPQGASGCDLLVAPDLLLAHVPGSGTVATQLAIPNANALIGAVIHQQVVPLELNGAGAITAFTSTNRLTLTIGRF